MDALKTGIQGIGNVIANTTQQAKDYIAPNQDSYSKTVNHQQKIETQQQQSRDS